MDEEAMGSAAAREKGLQAPDHAPVSRDQKKKIY